MIIDYFCFYKNFNIFAIVKEFLHIVFKVLYGFSNDLVCIKVSK